jgi:hypothetical protein
MAIRIRYKPLFGIECLHGYFADRVCRTLALSPTAAGARWFERYHLRFRSLPGGGAVYYEESASNLARLRQEPSSLAFALTVTDPLFDIYTEGGSGASPSGSVRYFSNHEDHFDEIRGQRRPLLHPPGQPFAQPPLTVRPSRFTCRFDPPARAADLQVLDADGQPVWRTKTPDRELHDWPIDLYGRSSGRYQLAIAGRAPMDFYLSDESLVRQWGVVEIFPKAIEQVPTFTISFASRETVWRYYIFEPEEAGSIYAGYEVVGIRKRFASTERSRGGDIRFVRQPQPLTVNGRRASVFESSQAVPLAELPGDDDYLFSFKSNGGSERSGRPIVLPFARPAATRPDATPDGARMISEIFVYL